MPAPRSIGGEIRGSLQTEPSLKARAILGCLLGTAVGDAMGLVCEGLSRRRQMKMFPELAGYGLLPWGKGMCSDDTEHTCMLAQSLIATLDCPEDQLARRFAANFAWRLRFWLTGLPAGIGLATLRAIVKLWIGFPPRWSGVFSAGNAPAMRSALIGVCCGDDPARMRLLVRAATRISHTDPKAEWGALAVALAAHHCATHGNDVTPAAYLEALEQHLGGEAPEFVELIRSVTDSVARGEDALAFAAHIGCVSGVTGYVYHTVPAALHVWLAHQGDYRAAIVAIIRLGGDTDTTAAIVGAITGARVGKAGIPQPWLDNLYEWPRTVGWMEELAARLAGRCDGTNSAGAMWLNPLSLLTRNLVFMLIVLMHGFRRLLPPY
jgi:ADP-ribosyl-[dinitrogen reductase] hydrolase